MLNALLLLAAVSFGQQSVEKIPIQHVTAESVVKAVSGRVWGIEQIVVDPTDNSILAKGTKEAIVLLRSLVRGFDQKHDVRSMPLKHLDAQYIHDLMKDSGWSEIDQGVSVGIVPFGLELTVDSRTNSLIVKGPPVAIREFELLLEQFDIPPHNVMLEVQGSIASLGRDITATNEIANGAVWSYSDLSANLKLQVRSSINGDGSVTILLSGSVAGKDIKQALRTRSDQTAYVRVDPYSLGTDKIVSYFVRDHRIDEAAYLKGTALSTIDPDLQDDNESLKGELRLILRASPK
jgi:type II secretory pathway component GspD/PulD (secretin)